MQDDRNSALEKLQQFTSAQLEMDDEFAWADFWDPIPTYRGHQMEEYANQLGTEVCKWWFWFDLPLEDDDVVPAMLLVEEGELALTSRERRYLELASESCLRLYEVVETSPGETVTFEDVIDGGKTMVFERTASRTLERGTLVAARVMPGPGSAPAVIEAGFFAFPGLAKRSMVEQTREHLKDFRTEVPGASTKEFFKEMVPSLFLAWVQLLVEPPVPNLANTDRETLLWTTTRFTVRDRVALIDALDRCAELERDGEKAVWSWFRIDAEGEMWSLGWLELSDDELIVETNSRERGERGRKLVESVAGDAVTFRIVSHQDIRQKVVDDLRSGRSTPSLPEEEDQLPREVEEEIVLHHYAQHYHRWVDIPIPALGGRTPREAAGETHSAAEVVKLIRELEGMYERCLRGGEPAYDPSWMWHELGLAPARPPQHAPPLAHERWDAAIPGLSDACGKAAFAIRNRSSFDERSTVATQDDLERDIEIQRLRRDASGDAPSDLITRLRFVVSFELHRRKVFWVDEALAFLLGKTDLDVDGGQLRVPFPAFALVLTDRTTLSYAERLLAADESCPIRGYLLQAVTVYVVEEGDGADRSLHLGLAFDTRGADPPYFIEHLVRAVEGEPVVVAPEPQIELETSSVVPPQKNPLGGLLEITLNAVLYAVSPASEKIQRPSPRPKDRKGSAGPDEVFASDDVFYLPGPISISQSRQLERLDHVPSGRQIMTRFMVRGHWRRPSRSWKDQSMRWIQPYWKGPDIAAVIERTYRLEP